MGDKKDMRRERAAETGKVLPQVGALPYRHEQGSLEVLLVTTRQTRRFTLPKGWRVKGKSNHKAARIEAKEEAGVTGKIAAEPIGSYFYWKRTARCFIPIKVTTRLRPSEPFLIGKSSGNALENGCAHVMRRF